MKITYCTAATLRAMLCYVESGITPTIAYDNDELAQPLADKLKDAVGNKGGSQSVVISFHDYEWELQRQFENIAGNISDIFKGMS